MYRKSYNDFKILSNSWDWEVQLFNTSTKIQKRWKSWTNACCESQNICKVQNHNLWFITVEKRKILKLLFTVTLIYLKNHWTLQSTLQKWRYKNKVTEKIIKSSSNPGISLCQIINDKMLWSKFQKWTFRNSHFWTKILNRSSVSIEINLLENWT